MSNWAVHPEIFLKTDHNIIICSLNNELVSHTRTIWKCNEANWDEWSNQLKVKLKRLNMENQNQLDPNLLHSELYEIIIETAKEVIGKKTIHNKHKAWWDNDLNSKLKEVKRAHKLFKKRSDINKKNRYLSLKQDFYDTYNAKRKEYWDNLIEKLNNPDSLWKVIGKNRKIGGSSIVQPIITGNAVAGTDEEIMSEMIKMYGNTDSIIADNLSKELAQIVKNHLQTTIYDHNNPIYLPITIEEVKSSINNLKDTAAISPVEDIHPLMLKHGGNDQCSEKQRKD